jgi:hypothetical protein
MAKGYLAALRAARRTKTRKSQTMRALKFLRLSLNKKVKQQFLHYKTEEII